MIEIDQFGLRSHTSAVKGIATLRTGDTIKLYSGDDSGTINEWDLPTRKLLGSWKIHNTPDIDAPIIGMRTLECDKSTENILYVHSKDHCLRFYDLSGRVTGNSEPNLLWEMPVNTLNFSNLLVLPTIKNRVFTVWCCNTEDTEGIDIYEIDLIGKSLQRSVRNEKFGDSAQRGIVMKFAESLDGKKVIVGYENGSCVTINTSSFGKEYEEIHFDKSCHFSQPILSLACSESFLFISQAKNNTIFKFNFDNREMENLNLSKSLEPELQIKELSVTGLCAETLGVENVLGFTTWETNKFYQIDISNMQLGAPVIQKSKSNVVPISIDPTGSLNTSVAGSRLNNNVKITVCQLLSRSLPSGEIITTKNHRVRYKRLNYMLRHNWAIVGYQDGNIVFYKVA